MNNITPMNNMIKNKGRGRKKRREIKQIEELSSRQVTFSKRRAGVFKKASELCILTGAKGAILCESIGGQVFAFGHPTVESIVDKYLGEGSTSLEVLENDSSATEVHVNSPCMHGELKKQYLEITKEIEVEKNKSENMMGGKINNNMVEGDLFWWRQPFKHLEVEELEKYISSMEELINKLTMRANDLMLIKSSSSMLDANKNLNSTDGLSDENKNLNTKDNGLVEEFFANKNLNTKDDRLLDEFNANKNLNFIDDGLLDELLEIKFPNFNDNGLDEFFADLEGGYGYNNVQVPNNYGNTGNELQLSHNNGNFVVSDDYGKAVGLDDCDNDVLSTDFSVFFT